MARRIAIMRRIVFHVALLGVEKSNPTEFKAHGPVINDRSSQSVANCRVRFNFWPSNLIISKGDSKTRYLVIYKRKGEIYKNFQKIHSETP